MTLHIESLDAEGRGVARQPDGKVVFVEGALPGEEVAFEPLRRKAAFDTARATRIVKPAASRVAPRCPYFGVCGGCSLQHADARTQMAAKQRWLEESFARIGGVAPELLLPIVYGEDWGYRRRARLGVRLVPKKGGVLV
ncbi:MAG TPA: TRAM domain-containing protein, partial [Burkholderiales bacterium]|nr:TRAM domain-containing protein [Burkholderiales bacterium]